MKSLYMQQTNFRPKIYKMLTLVYDDKTDDIYIVTGLVQLSISTVVKWIRHFEIIPNLSYLSLYFRVTNMFVSIISCFEASTNTIVGFGSRRMVEN